MSIYGNPIMIGGSGGGGGGNAWASLDAPSASVGADGDYYFQLSDKAINYSFDNIATNPSGGWEFRVNASLRIVGVRVFSLKNLSGKTVTFGTATGTVLKSVTLDYVANEWVDAVFDEPVVIEPNVNYVVLANPEESRSLKWMNRPTMTTSRLTYVTGRTGSFPGSQEGNVAYSVDLILGSPPYGFQTQYYKSGGTWSEVT